MHGPANADGHSPGGLRVQGWRSKRDWSDGRPRAYHAAAKALSLLDGPITRRAEKLANQRCASPFPLLRGSVGRKEQFPRGTYTTSTPSSSSPSFLSLPQINSTDLSLASPLLPHINPHTTAMSNLPSEPEFEQALYEVTSTLEPVSLAWTRLTKTSAHSSSCRRSPSTDEPSPSSRSPSESSSFESPGRRMTAPSLSTEDTESSTTRLSARTRVVSDSTPPSTCPSSSSSASSRPSRTL